MANRTIIVGEEAVYGTAVPTTAHYAIAGESLKRKPSLSSVRPERHPAASREVNHGRSVAGGLDVYLGWTGLAAWLRSAVSLPAVEDLGSGALRRTYLPDPHYRPASLTVDVERDVAIHRYSGLFVQALRFSAGLQDKHFGLSLQCLGADEAQVAGRFPEEPALEPPIGIGQSEGPAAFQLTLSDGATTWIAGTEGVELNCTWDRRLRESERSLVPSGIVGGGVVQGSFKTRWTYDSDTDWLLEAFRSRASISAALSIQGALIGGGIYQALEIDLPACRISADPPTLRTAGFLNIDFSNELAALFPEGAAYGPMRMRLTDGA